MEIDPRGRALRLGQAAIYISGPNNNLGILGNPKISAQTSHFLRSSSFILGTFSGNMALRVCLELDLKQLHLGTATDNQVEQCSEEKVDSRRFVS